MTKRLSRADLVKQLGASIGQEKATEVVDAAAKGLRLQGDAFDCDETIRLLEVIAKQPGLVGTVARFAKARIILHFG